MTTTTETLLPFDEWQDKAKLMPIEEGAAALDIDRDYFPNETTHLLIYPGDLYIECMSTREYYLLIANMDWISTDLEALEWELYSREYAA
jgi:hypothetical protein